MFQFTSHQPEHKIQKLNRLYIRIFILLISRTNLHTFSILLSKPLKLYVRFICFCHKQHEHFDSISSVKMKESQSRYPAGIRTNAIHHHLSSIKFHGFGDIKIARATIDIELIPIRVYSKICFRADLEYDDLRWRCGSGGT